VTRHISNQSASWQRSESNRATGGESGGERNQHHQAKRNISGVSGGNINGGIKAGIASAS